MLDVITTSFLKKMASDLAKAIFEILTERSKNIINRSNLNSIQYSLEQHVQSVRMVKTLWQLDKPVDISSFFICPSVQFENSRRKVSKITDFQNSSSLLIEGIAGQGKSILMRHLCACEMIEAKSIPIFIEIRKISREKNILSLISQWFDELDISLSAGEIRNLIKSGNLVLFLDGLDEVIEADKSNVIDQIEEIAGLAEKSKSGTRLIVSARPFAGLESSPKFHTVRISHLTDSEAKEAIFKLSENEYSASVLIGKLAAHRGGVNSLLVTPLLVTLLIITYKAFSELPEQLSDFYDVLFYVLLKRHDGTKPGFTRARKCAVKDSVFREIFDAFCFESKQSKDISYARSEVFGFSRSAISYCGSSMEKLDLKVEAEDFVEDVLRVTCLIVNDGDEFRFIHKSIQEYFCASFISSLPESLSAQIIRRIIVKKKYYEWEQELRFLSEINPYIFSKYFKLPFLKEMAARFGGPKGLSKYELKLIYADAYVSIKTSGGGRDKLRIAGVKFKQRGVLANILYFYINEKEISHEIFIEITRPKNSDLKERLIKNKHFSVVSELAQNNDIARILSRHAGSMLDSLNNEISRTENYIARKEDASFVGGMSLASLHDLGKDDDDNND